MHTPKESLKRDSFFFSFVSCVSNGTPYEVKGLLRQLN